MTTQLTKNFTVEEFEHSDTAKACKISNKMPEVLYANAKELCEHVLQPVRDWCKCPITITSGYRSSELNRRLPGASTTSQHMDGCAADIVCSNVSLEKIYNWIVAHCDFDQLLFERDAHGNRWLHVSFKKIDNRHQAIFNYKA